MLLVLFRRQVPALGPVSILGPSQNLNGGTPPAALARLYRMAQAVQYGGRAATLASGLHSDTEGPGHDTHRVQH